MAYDAGFANVQVHQARELATGFVTLGTRDLARASRFYEQIAREMGIGRSAESDHFVGWGVPGVAAGFGIALPGAVPEVTRGMVPLQVDEPEQVERLYEIALRNGGAGEVAPGDCGGFYAAYFRDPDGNRLNAFCVSQH
ncbi:MAG: VOC family protein [Hyphomonadaceae bacterium]|nr:VOC family protein [Hyphomonadaceae bacterium]